LDKKSRLLIRFNEMKIKKNCNIKQRQDILDKLKIDNECLDKTCRKLSKKTQVK